MTTPTALVIGEALVDEFPHERVVAGAPLHVATHLVALGWTVRMLTRVGDDSDGRSITETLQRYGVDASLVQIDAAIPTGVTSIELHGSDHSFTVAPGAWDALVAPANLPPTDVIYFGTLVLRDPRSRAAVEQILSTADATVVVDLNLREPDYDDMRIRQAIEAADILKLNDDELPIACAAFGVPPHPDALHEFGPTWVCITRGGDGASLSHVGGGIWQAPAPPVDVIDTVGAGDAFCAALIDGLIRGTPPEDTITAAAARGSRIAAQRGGLPPEPSSRS